MIAGVEEAVVRYNGTVHDFMMLNVLALMAPAKAAVRQVVEALKAKLG